MISTNTLKYKWYPDDTQLYTSYEFWSISWNMWLQPLSFTFSAEWTRINCSSIHLQLHFFSSAQNNNVLNFLISQINLSAMLSFQSVHYHARNLGVIFESDMYFSNQITSVSKSCHFRIRDIRRFRHLLPLSIASTLKIYLIPTNLTSVIHLTLTSHEQISKKLLCIKIWWSHTFI